MGFITARKVGKRSTGVAKYSIVYIPKEIEKAMKMKPGQKIVILMPDDRSHFEVWPMDVFVKYKNEGKV